MPPTRPLSVRFWEKVVRDEFGCWLWVGGKTSDGYGAIGRGPGHKGSSLAHRIGWELAEGRPVPAGLEVCHHCDVPACVRPDHLFLGTHRDNVRDCAAKGRMRGHRYQAGRAHLGAKITEADVRAIRAATETHRAIGARFGISKRHVGEIRRGRSWASVR